MFRDEGEKACKGVNRGWDENHEESMRRLNLNEGGCHSHHKTQCPTAITRKRKGDDLAAAEARPEVYNIGHAFQCKVDALHERNLFTAVFLSCQQALSEHMIADEAGNNEKYG